ncbi:acetate--CoA ligase [Desulfobacula sp.]|uniref:acetate--CoA ligase n=1 Tax=Desulfobacula sp. TaxID=2593537 RepID=UPI0027147548|nr:acetate--CoA ligase [Desulfobacula sp.]
MSEFKFHAPDEYRENAWIKTIDEYKEMYNRSIEKPDEFWAEMAEQFHWEKKWDNVRDFNYSISKGPVNIEWFRGGKTNITYNCLDRHLKDRGDQTALIWEGNNVGEDLEISYKQLHEKVCQFANALKSKGVQKGDRVAIYMPMVPELAVTMLACARIGAIHSIVFGGFSSDALSNRILDSHCKILVTTDGVMRGAKAVPLKGNADTAMDLCEKNGHSVECCFVVKRTGSDIEMKEGRDVWWHEEAQKQSSDCPVEWMDAEDPLFILYTSGSTGTPKGVQHNVGGYMVYTGITFRYIFDYHDNDIFWCTADIGWVTGHSYIVYGPLANGSTSLMFEGVPTYPDAGRFWHICDKFGVTVFYTAPTAIRALMRLGEEWPAKYKLDSLRILGSVGEPINPEAWMWYYEKIGRKRCPIVDTWWQTETGGFMITPLPGTHTLKPGSASRPFFGVDSVVLRDDASQCDVNEGGKLCIRKPWPGMMRTMWGDHDRFIDTYFTMYDNIYFAGDGCRIDQDGDYWLMGRIDDVVNVSGHRIGTAEVESALVSHEKVAEAAVTPVPHNIKGQGLYAFVTLIAGVEETDELKKELVKHVRKQIGPIATPEAIQFAPALPKTRSGKIMRRILRKIAEKNTDNLGDISTLADPSIVEALIKGRSE